MLFPGEHFGETEILNTGIDKKYEEIDERNIALISSYHPELWPELISPFILSEGGLPRFPLKLISPIPPLSDSFMLGNLLTRYTFFHNTTDNKFNQRHLLPESHPYYWVGEDLIKARRREDLERIGKAIFLE